MIVTRQLQSFSQLGTITFAWNGGARTKTLNGAYVLCVAAAMQVEKIVT